MFEHIAALHQLRQSLFVGDAGNKYEGYTDSEGNYFDGGMEGVDILPTVHVRTDQYGESTFQCMDHNCMLEDGTVSSHSIFDLSHMLNASTPCFQRFY
jgi:hypothetical protein